jgi:hypothetical protein
LEFKISDLQQPSSAQHHLEEEEEEEEAKCFACHASLN